jgi:SAM-dependent methyltransferase
MPISDHFGRVANTYAACRPTYPAQLFDYLVTLTEGHHLAWDVGAGNGQASVPLAARFHRVLATDRSAEQLAQATRLPNLEYHAAPAEQSGLEAASVDLVTVAQAAHWFDLPAFYAEVRRVLAPGGALALWTYGTPHLDDPGANAVFQRWSTEVVGSWWPPERKWVDEGYRTIPFPFAERTPPPLELAVDWTLPELIGYTTTWSAVGRYREALGDDPVPQLRQELLAVWPEVAGPSRIRWPLSMRVSA